MYRYRCRPSGAFFFFNTRFYTDTEEIRRNTQKHPIKDPYQKPQANKPYGTKERFWRTPRFLAKIRFGWETEPTGPESEAVIFAKIDTYGVVLRRARPNFAHTRQNLS